MSERLRGSVTASRVRALSAGDVVVQRFAPLLVLHELCGGFKCQAHLTHPQSRRRYESLPGGFQQFREFDGGSVVELRCNDLQAKRQPISCEPEQRRRSRQEMLD